MATELEAAVIAAARAYVNAPAEPQGPEDPEAPRWSDLMEGLYLQLSEAVDALGAAEAAPDTEAWGRLVSGDQIWSEKVGKWFEVLEVKTAGGRTTALLAGGVRFTKPAGETVKVKRSDLGLAMDRFETLWSGPNGART